MKKYILFFLFFAGIFSLVSAQTMTVHVSGTITDDSTGAPVPNHQVIITSDSSSGFYFYTTRMTNANGAWDCTIQNVPSATPDTFYVRTLDCNNNYHQEWFLSTNSPAIVNFVICTGVTQCEAAYEYYPDTTNFLAFHFHSTSYVAPGSTIVSYHWDFGDGSPAGTTQDPWHIYLVGGTYTVCLTIATSTGCTSVKCHNVSAMSGECHARYEFHRDSTNVLKLHFFDTSIIPSGSQLISRLWNFGDPAAGINNTATTGDPWHTYLQAGYYNVCLTITTSTGCTSTKCDTIHVGETPVNCESWFTYTKDFLTVHFEGHTNSSYPTTWLWNFGDPNSGSGNTSTLQFPTHMYTVPGEYHVILHTLDSTGCDHTSDQTINVHGTVDLYGVVMAGANLVDHGFIQLIRADSGNVMTVVDSQQFGDSAGMYWFGGVLPGHYYLKAELLPSSAYYGQFVPTYYIEALNWTNANLIELGPPQNPYNFHLRHASGAGVGNGNISGTITQGTKVNTGGTPAANVEVLLLDEINKPLSYTQTDNNGHFEFSAIALGTYTVWPEVAGLATSPATITLTAGTPVFNLPFTINNGHVLYGINDNLPQYIISVGDLYPNPPDHGEVKINLSVARELSLTFRLYNQTGQVVFESGMIAHKGANTMHFDISNLAKGPYYLRISSPEGGNIIRKLSLIQ